MQPLKWLFGAAIIAAWFSWDFGAVCVRTFVLGHSLRRQLTEIEEDGE